MNDRSYRKKWKECSKCIKEVCKDIHKHTDNDFVFYNKSDTLIIDGQGFHIDVVCIAEAYPPEGADKITVRTDERSVLFTSDELLRAFDYILNDFKYLQLEDAIKITNFRNKQLKFIANKKEKKC